MSAVVLRVLDRSQVNLDVEQLGFREEEIGAFRQLIAKPHGIIVVTGPRIDPATLPKVEGLELRAYVHNLYRHLAACDLAVVQGGLTTTMELAALHTPFFYFPLRNHFEQQFFVSRRLERLGAGVRMDFDRTSPEELGAAILDQLGKPVHPRDVPVGGTARAARLIANLL